MTLTSPLGASRSGCTPVSDPVLEIKNLSVDYGYDDDPVHVLRQVSLTLGRGEVLGLAGESGCGKSTLAYAATRLLPPPGLITGGEVLFTDRDGRQTDILRLNDTQLRASRWQDLAIVFQGAMNSLNPVFRIGRQIADGIRAHRPEVSQKEALERSAELLELVGISPDRLRSYPHQLSGGMRQRVMIAMALALDPQVLIMDEPTTALDVVMQRADRGADRRPARTARLLGHLHHARRVAAHRDRRPHRDHVRGRDRRGRRRARRVPAAAASVLVGAAALVPAAARAAARAHRHPRLAARPVEAAAADARSATVARSPSTPARR